MENSPFCLAHQLEIRYKEHKNIFKLGNAFHLLNTKVMDDFSFRFKFDVDMKNKARYHSQRKHLKISKIAKFGRKIL